MRMRLLHRLLGVSLLVFIAMHLGNHIALFWGVDQHLAVQKALRPIYRHPVVEPILLSGFALQLFLGIRILLQRGLSRRFWPRIQWFSGIVLMLFLVQHIGAALYTRAFWPNIDTNIYWAASVVSRMPFSLYFVPYYALGVVAVFLHIGAFIALRKRYQLIASLICILGAVFAVGLVATLSGAFFSIDLPLQYISYLTNVAP
jgi:hypothetical protein